MLSNLNDYENLRMVHFLMVSNYIIIKCEVQDIDFTE